MTMMRSCERKATDELAFFLFSGDTKKHDAFDLICGDVNAKTAQLLGAQKSLRVGVECYPVIPYTTPIV